MEKILLALVAKTLNKSIEEVATLIQNDDENKSVKDNALQSLLDLDAIRVTELKGKGGDTKESFDKGYKKATAELLTKRDNDVKEHYGLTTELKGLDLVNEVLKVKLKAIETKEITPDEIKTSPTYQTAIQKLNDANKLKIVEINDNHSKEIKVFKRKEDLVSVISAADKLIDSEINPIWSKDAVRSLSQRKLIHDSISTSNYKDNPGGLPIVLDSEGKALEDAHGNPITFKEHITSKVTALLDLQTSKNRKSAGTHEEEAADVAVKESYNWNGQKPKDDDQFIKMTSEANSSEEKMDILKSYKETKQE